MYYSASIIYFLIKVFLFHNFLLELLNMELKSDYARIIIGKLLTNLIFKILLVSHLNGVNF